MDWLIDWLVGCLFHWLIGWLTDLYALFVNRRCGRNTRSGLRIISPICRRMNAKQNGREWDCRRGQFLAWKMRSRKIPLHLQVQRNTRLDFFIFVFWCKILFFIRTKMLWKIFWSRMNSFLFLWQKSLRPRSFKKARVVRVEHDLDSDSLCRDTSQDLSSPMKGRSLFVFENERDFCCRFPLLDNASVRDRLGKIFDDLPAQQQVNIKIDRLNSRLIDWWFDWLIDWLIRGLIDWLIDWSVVWLIDWLIDPWFDWLVDWLIRGLIDWLIGWLIDCFKV